MSEPKIRIDQVANLETRLSSSGSLSNIRISANSTGTVNANGLNFVNTSTVTVSITSGANGNANISFTSAGGGSGSGVVIVRDNFTGDGNTSNFTLSTEPQSEDHVLVFVDLVFQSENAFSISGDTLAFSTAPDSGSDIDVYIYGGGVGSTVVTSDVFSGTGACTSYTLSQTGTASRTFVYLDGVAQRPQYDYQVSGTALSFNVAPANTSVIEVRTLSALNTVDINVAPVTIDSDLFTGTGSCTQFTLSQTSTTDSTFVFINGVAQKPGTNYTVGGVGNNVLTMVSAPANGSILEVRSMGAFKIIENQSRIDSDVFSGDGTTTVFTLSTSSVTRKVFAFIDGVSQKPFVDYNVGGNKITFVEAPPSGTSIEVRSVSPFVFATSTSDLAYDQANSAFSRANTANTQANLAYAQANAAYSAANNRVLKTGDTMTGNLIMSGSTVNVATINANTIVSGTTLTLSTGAASNGNVVISANGTEYVRVTNTGNIGIGITTPNTLFHVNGTITLQEVKEKVNISATALGANLTIDLLEGAVVFLTAIATANSTINFRGNSTVSMNTFLSTGQSITSAVIVTTGSTAYRIANVQIDGTSITPKWSGGSAPTASANSVEAYSFTIIKNAANAQYTVLGSKTQFA